jgi:hypothetical protein
MLEDADIIRINTRYKLVNELYSTNLSAILDDIDKSRCPITLKMLTRAIHKIDSLINHYIEHNDLEHFYVNTIISRAIMEHFLVAIYVSVKNEEENNDNTAIEYYDSYLESELIKRAAYSLRHEGSMKGIDGNDSLENINKELKKNYTPSERTALHSIQKKFDIRNIIDYLIKLPESHSFKQTAESFPVIVDLYNISSSYVHGGAVAEKEHYEWFANELQTMRLKRFETYSKLMIVILKESVLFKMMEFDAHKYYTPCKPLHDFMRKEYARITENNS